MLGTALMCLLFCDHPSHFIEGDVGGFYFILFLFPIASKFESEGRRKREAQIVEERRKVRRFHPPMIESGVNVHLNFRTFYCMHIFSCRYNHHCLSWIDSNHCWKSCAFLNLLLWQRPGCSSVELAPLLFSCVPTFHSFPRAWVGQFSLCRVSWMHSLEICFGPVPVRTISGRRALWETHPPAHTPQVSCPLHLPLNSQPCLLPL